MDELLTKLVRTNKDFILCVGKIWRKIENDQNYFNSMLSIASFNNALLIRMPRQTTITTAMLSLFTRILLGELAGPLGTAVSESLFLT